MYLPQGSRKENNDNNVDLVSTKARIIRSTCSNHSIIQLSAEGKGKQL